MKNELDRLLDEGIKPHASQIAEIVDVNDVAVVFFEVAKSNRQAARQLGWKGGKSEVQRWTQEEAEAFAANLPAFDKAAAWLRTRAFGRIFAFAQAGTLCINYEPGAGFSLARGTTDRETFSG